MKRRIYIIAATILIATLTLSCSEDAEVNNSDGGQEGKTLIQFTVDDSQDWMQTGNDIATTRAIEQGLFAPQSVKMTSKGGDMEEIYLNTSVVNGIDGTAMGGSITRGTTTSNKPLHFAVSGFSGNAPQAPDLFHNVTASSNDGLSWQTDGSYYWPQNNTASFFAYTPVATNSNGIKLSPVSYVGKPYIDFTVQDDIEQQLDLMTASSGPITFYSGTQVRLPFKHALTCVKFVMGSGLPAGKKIARIVLKNISKKGTYYFDEVNPSWVASTTDLEDYTIASIGMETSTNENTLIAPVGKDQSYATLLMVPQAFNSEDQKIEVYFDDGVNPLTSLSATLNGTQWLAGTTVTYKLNSNAQQKFVLEVEPILVGHNGGDTSFKVTSYKQNGNSKEAMPWRVIGYSTDGITYTSEKPSGQTWVGIQTTEGAGGTAPETGYVRIGEQISEATLLTEQEDTIAQKAVMISNGIRGTNENPWDLSTHNLAGQSTPMNTANCYIVNAPGVYKIPLVYGNAITDGVENRDAYLKTPNLDYLDRSITNPYIYNNTDNDDNPYTPNDAIVLWQDAKNLVQNIRLSVDKHFIVFEITDSNIRQGNAVLCIRDNTADGNGHTGRIMWSWHIWVTGIDVSAVKKLTNADHRRFDVLPVPVGFCSRGGTQASYAGRELYVKIQQNSGMTAILHINQMKGVDFTGFTNGNAPYYHYGRSIPYKPAAGWTNGKNETDKKLYWNEDYDFSTSGQMTLGTAIQKPYSYVSVNDDVCYCNSSVYKLWDGNAALNTFNAPSWNYTTLKTIYDPCPPGFHIPNIYTFTGLQSGEHRNGYYTYYINGTHSDWIFFPPLGIRNRTNSGNLNFNASYYVGSYIDIWMNRPSRATGSYCMSVTSGGSLNSLGTGGGMIWGRVIFAAAER